MLSQQFPRAEASPVEREPIYANEAGWGAIITFIVMTATLLLVIPLIRLTTFGQALRGPAWWENLNLFVALMVATVGGVALLIGRLRLTDVGIRRDKLLQGVLVTAIVWGAMQAWPVIASGSAELARTWQDPGVVATLRWAAVMFLATALWEEVAFRGFLLPQLYLKFRGHHRVRLAGALLLSQVVFATAHLPAHIMIRDLSGIPLLHMLLLQCFAGLLLALLYLRTRNLWIAVGIHGLANAPTPLSGGALGWEVPLLILLVGWPWLARRPMQRGLAHIQTDVLYPPKAGVGS